MQTLTCKFNVHTPYSFAKQFVSHIFTRECSCSFIILYIVTVLVHLHAVSFIYCDGIDNREVD